MKKLVLKSSLLGISGLVGVLSLAAQAQPKPILSTPLPVGKPSKLADTTWTKVGAYEKNIIDSMDVAVSKQLMQTPALTGFRLRFDNGDHKFRRVAVLTKGESATFAFSDSNGDDPFSAQASWAMMCAGRIGEISGVGGGQLEVPLPTAKMPGHHLVLRGFELARRGGTDANVRAIGVWMDEMKNVARVTLMDDEGQDFRGFERTIGLVLASGMDPFGALGATLDGIEQADKIIKDSEGVRRGYAFKVQYAWIPNDVITGQSLLSGTGQIPSSGKGMGNPAVLQGFEFFFRNSDHYLKDIGIVPERAGSRDPQLDYYPPKMVSFQDNNLDDPIRWSARFLTIEPKRER